MLNQIVGPVEWSSAAVLIAICAMLCVTITTAIGKRRTARSVELEFEIGRLKLQNEDEADKRRNQRQLEMDLTKLAFDKEVEIKRIDSGLLEATVN